MIALNAAPPKRSHFVTVGPYVFRPVSTAIAAVLIEQAARASGVFTDTEEPVERRMQARAEVEDLYYAMAGVHWAGQAIPGLPSWRRWAGDWADYGALVRDALQIPDAVFREVADALTAMLTRQIMVETEANAAENFTETTPSITGTST